MALLVGGVSARPVAAPAGDGQPACAPCRPGDAARARLPASRLGTASCCHRSLTDCSAAVTNGLGHELFHSLIQSNLGFLVFLEFSLFTLGRRREGRRRGGAGETQQTLAQAWSATWGWISRPESKPRVRAPPPPAWAASHRCSSARVGHCCAPRRVLPGARPPGGSPASVRVPKLSLQTAMPEGLSVPCPGSRRGASGRTLEVAPPAARFPSTPVSEPPLCRGSAPEDVSLKLSGTQLGHREWVEGAGGER